MMFLNTTPNVYCIKQIIDQIDFIKVKNICSATDWELMFTKDTFDKGLLVQNMQRSLKIQWSENKKSD